MHRCSTRCCFIGLSYFRIGAIGIIINSIVELNRTSPSLPLSLSLSLYAIARVKVRAAARVSLNPIKRAFERPAEDIKRDKRDK